MLFYQTYLEFTPFGRRRITSIEEELMTIDAKEIANGVVPILPLAIMGFLNGVFGEAGSATILVRGLSDTVFFDVSATRYYLSSYLIDFPQYPKLRKYYAPFSRTNAYPVQFPDADFFAQNMNLSGCPHEMSFRYHSAKLTFRDPLNLSHSYRNLRLS